MILIIHQFFFNIEQTLPLLEVLVMWHGVSMIPLREVRISSTLNQVITVIRGPILKVFLQLHLLVELLLRPQVLIL